MAHPLNLFSENLISMAKSNSYVKALQKDKKTTSKYYLKSLSKKTEQQKFLEKLLANEKFLKPVNNVADIACGAGSLSFHLSKLKKFEKTNFELVDFNPDAIRLAKKNIKDERFKYIVGSIYNLKQQKSNCFELVFCWQTLSWLENPEDALRELIRITKPGGKIYLSSLFNTEFDVDVYSKVIDHSHKSASQDLSFSYNTYSEFTVKKWLKGRVKKYKIHVFKPTVDFKYKGKGLGTFTEVMRNKSRIQVSGGMLLNWAILEITK